MNNQVKKHTYKPNDVVVMVSKRRSKKLWTWVSDTNWRPNHSLLDCGDGLLHPYSNTEFRLAKTSELDAGCRLND
jgi:hypothetical protein